MTKMTLQDCIDLARFAHRHQYDKAGEPYINHPLRVLESVKTQGAQAYVQMAAVLHDVTEDTPFTPHMLLTLGVPEAAVEIVRLVDREYSAKVFHHHALRINSQSIGSGGPKVYYTHTQGTPESKAEKDNFYYAEIRKNPGAVQVKLADIGDNLQPWRLAYLPEDTQDRLRRKYAKAIELLT